MKKKIALILALMMVGTAVVSGCKKDENVDGNNTDGNTNVEQNGETANGGETSDDGSESDFVAPEIKTTEYDGINVVKIDGKEYSASMYRCMLYQVADAIGGTDTSVWEESTIESLKDWASLWTLCKEYDISLGDSDYEQVYDLRSQTLEEYDNAEAYYADLEMYHMTDAVYVENITQNVLFTKFAEAFVADFVPDDQDVLDYINSEYVRVKHILIKTEDLDDSQKAEARSRADRVRERAISGESFEDLVEEISEDGMDPELGYYFTYGTMVQEFEDASYALEEGEISEIVESQFGYHIIKKYPMEEAHIFADEQLLSAASAYLCNEEYMARVEEIMAKADVEYLEGFEKVKAEILAEILEAKAGTAEETLEAETLEEETAETSEETVVA